MFGPPHMKEGHNLEIPLTPFHGLGENTAFCVFHGAILGIEGAPGNPGRQAGRP